MNSMQQKNNMQIHSAPPYSSSSADWFSTGSRQQTKMVYRNITMNGSSVHDNYRLPTMGNCVNGNCGNGNCVNGNCGNGNSSNGNCGNGNCGNGNGMCGDVNCGDGRMVGYYDGAVQRLPRNYSFVDYSRSTSNGYAADGTTSKSFCQRNDTNINQMFDTGAMQSSMLSPGTSSQMINANYDLLQGHQMSSGSGFQHQSDSCHPTAMPMPGMIRSSGGVRGQMESEFGSGGAMPSMQRMASYPPTTPPQRVVPPPNPQQYMMTKRAQYNGLRRMHPYDPTCNGATRCTPRLPRPPSQQQQLQQPVPPGYSGMEVVLQQVKDEQNNPYLQMGMHNGQYQSSSSSSWGNSVQFRRESVEFSPPPGNPTPPMTPGLSSVPCHVPSMFPGGGGGGDSSVFSGHVRPESSTESRTIERQTLNTEEQRFTFETHGGIALPPFQLEHNLPTSSHVFPIQDQFYETLMTTPDLELVLRCFHKERPTATNWPASINVRLNGVPLAIDRTNALIHRPLHLKSLCKPGPNVLEISVTACCCSHLFLMETVQRPTVSSILHSLLNKRLLPARKSIEKIKQILSITKDQSSTIPLTCALSNHTRRIVLPSRGRHCRHAQCFDLETYLKMNCVRNNWTCPICNKAAGLEGLEVDQYIWAILIHLSSSYADAVVVNASGNWKIFQKNGAGINKDTKKYITFDGMVLPTPNSYFASRFPALDVQQGTSACSGVCSNGNCQERPEIKPKPEESTSDYLGCLSELTNIFLPTTTADNSPNNAGHQSNGGGGADHISFPPTPLSGHTGQTCTPLDGQLLHPRTPSDGGSNTTHPRTPPDGLVGYPCTPLDSYAKTPNDGARHESAGNNPYDSAFMNNGGKIDTSLAALSASDARATASSSSYSGNAEKTGIGKSEFSATHGQTTESHGVMKTPDFDEPFTEMIPMADDDDDPDMLNFLSDDFDNDPSELASYLGPESRAPVYINNSTQPQHDSTNHRNTEEDSDLLSFLS